MVGYWVLRNLYLTYSVYNSLAVYDLLLKQWRVQIDAWFDYVGTTNTFIFAAKPYFGNFVPVQCSAVQIVDLQEDISGVLI